MFPILLHRWPVKPKKERRAGQETERLTKPRAGPLLRKRPRCVLFGQSHTAGSNELISYRPLGRAITAVPYSVGAQHSMFLANRLPALLL
jgi:hypothetical protein